MDLSDLSQELKVDVRRVDELKIFATTKEDLDLDLDDNPIIENILMSYPLHANTDVLDGEVKQHIVEQIVDVPVSPETAQEHISECIVEQIVGSSLVQQSRQTPLEDTPRTWNKSTLV